jgi:hypothetical protein
MIGDSLFGGSVLESRQVQAMPMDQIGVAGVVGDLDVHGASFAQPQHRSRDAIVVSGGLDRLAGRQFEGNRTDADGVIDCTFSGLHTAQARRDACGAGPQQKAPSAHPAWAKIALGVGKQDHRVSPFTCGLLLFVQQPFV